jgi:hypothetical protein
VRYTCYAHVMKGVTDMTCGVSWMPMMMISGACVSWLSCVLKLLLRAWQHHWIRGHTCSKRI